MQENIIENQLFDFPALQPLQARVENPDFPINCFPDVIKNYALAVAEHTQTAVEMAATIGLVVFSSAVFGKYKIEGKPGYEENLNLYLIVVSPSGNRKTPVFELMTDCLRIFEEHEKLRKASLISERNAQRKRLEYQIKYLKKQIEKRVNDEAINNLINLEEELKKYPIIRSPKIYTSETTSEKLEVLLSQNNERFTVISDESGTLDVILGRYSNGASNLDIWLKAYNGSPHDSQRMSREVRLNHPLLTAILCAQPIVLQKLIKNSVVNGRGFLARFLFISPEKKMGEKFLTEPINSKVKDDYEQAVIRLLSTERAISQILTLSPEALDIYQKYYTSCIDDYSDTEYIPEWSEKYRGTILRIAGIFELAKGEKTVVSAETMNNAIKVAEYYRDEAVSVFSETFEETELKKAKFVVKKIKENRIHRIKRAELFRICRGKFFKKIEDFEPTVELLSVYGYIIIKRSGNQTGPGRPADIELIINPRLDRTE